MTEDELVEKMVLAFNDCRASGVAQIKAVLAIAKPEIERALPVEFYQRLLTGPEQNAGKRSDARFFIRQEANARGIAMSGGEAIK